METIENKTYDELEVGQSAQITRTLTRKDIQLFAIMSGDVNPAHLDENYARSSQFHEIIAHGMWGGVLISTVLGTVLPGPGTIYLKQDYKFIKPVALGDMVTITVTVKEKLPKSRVVLDSTCVDQDGNELITGEALVKAPTEKVRRPRAKLPSIEMKESDSARNDQMMEMAKEYKPLKVAVVHPTNAGSLGGAVDSALEGFIEPILVGPKDEIKAAADEANLDISGFEIVDTKFSKESAQKAVELASQGAAESVMKGNLHTDEFMMAILAKEAGLRTGRRMSHVFSMDVPSYHKPLYLTDAVVNIRPDLRTKKDIIQNAIDFVFAITGQSPKVAILSAVEVVEEKIPSTLDATALCKMADRGQITGGILDGPLAMDNAISFEAARVKGISSPVAGDADILMVPDIESGNMLFKQMRYLSGYEGGGLALGSKVPVILTSRAGGPKTRKASCAMALLYQRRKEEILK